MTFDDYFAAVDSQPVHIPGTVPPPGVTGTRTDLLRSYANQIRGFPTNRNQRTDLLSSYSDAIAPQPSPTPTDPNLARFGRNVGKFLGSRSTTNPSFQPMGNEQLAGIKDQLIKLLLGSNPPPGFRDMPRDPNAPIIPETNTQVIPGPAQPEGTPYPQPPFLNLRNWMDTGERGPLPLNSFREGGYPAPAYTPMPEAYDALTSGGALA